MFLPVMVSIFETLTIEFKHLDINFFLVLKYFTLNLWYEILVTNNCMFELS